mgnify:CR=1 FL=1
MKKKKIFLFGKVIVIFYISVAVILFCIGIGFLWWLSGEDNWIATLIVCIPSGLMLILSPLSVIFDYIVRNNDKIEEYSISGKKRRSYSLSDLYEVSVKKLLGYRITGEYICLYFSEKSKQETKDLEDYSEIWKTKEIIPIAYAKKNITQLREMLGEEVWKEKYKE